MKTRMFLITGRSRHLFLIQIMAFPVIRMLRPLQTHHGKRTPITSSASPFRSQSV